MRGSRSEVEETGNYLAVNDVRFLTNLYAGTPSKHETKDLS